MGFTAVSILVSIATVGSEIRPDEVVQFYPSYAYRNSDGRSWTVLVRGSIFEPEEQSFARAATIRLIQRALPVEITDDQRDLFEERVRGFLVDDEGGKTVTVRVGARRFDLDASNGDGFIESQLTWQPAAEVHRRLSPASGNWLSFQAITPEGDDRQFFGWVQLVGERGLSVISDIDDTIKDSRVLSREQLLTNTFLRPFRAIPQMADLYRAADRQGVVFHYVSGSPWQLYDPLWEFIEDEGFPAGSMHLRTFELSASSLTELATAPEQTKFDAIRPLLKAFPNRRFVLIGDSGEQDPEIYGQLAREHPGQIVAIMIRRVPEADNGEQRFQKAFNGLSPKLWNVFQHGHELEEPLNQLIRQQGTAGN